MLTEEEYDRRWRRYGLIVKPMLVMIAMALATAMFYGPGWFRGLLLAILVPVIMGFVSECKEREDHENSLYFRNRLGINPPEPEKPAPYKGWQV